MTTIEAQSSLFQTTVEAPSIVYPGTRFELVRKGTRIAGSIRLDEPNPKRRRDCRVDYIRPKYWEDTHEAIALRVAGHWFKVIGGIILLQKKQLGHIIARLRKGQSETVLHWAIDAYANSPWHIEKKGWMSMGRFFTGESFDTWLERSPDYKSRLDEIERERVLQAERKRREALAVKPKDLADDHLRHHYRCAKSDQAKRYAAYEPVGFESFKRLDDNARTAMVKKCMFERQGAWCDSACGGPMSMDNEFFAGYVYSRVLHDRQRREGVSMDTLLSVSPTTPYRLHELQDEVERRARAGSGIHSTSDAIRHGRSEDARQMITTWLET